MAAFINTNIASLNSQRNLNSSQTALTTSLQRLSSGLRINSAKDDAAGLAISERMTSQINGSDQAARNANDGISLAQTAEGDLAQIGTNLQRMRELAVQASNGTNSASDRAALNGEVQSLAAEIDRVAQNSSFNGVKLLDGSFSSQDFQIGANNTSNDRITIASISSARTSELGGVGTSFESKVTTGKTTGALAAGDVTLNGFQVGTSQMGMAPGQSAGSASSIANAINAISADSGVTATANSNTVSGVAANTPAAIAADTFSINGVSVGAIASGTTSAGQGANVAAAINKISTQTGVTAKADATTGAVSLTAADGRDVNLALSGTAASPTAAATAKASFLANTGLTADKASAVSAGTGVATTGTFTMTASAAGGTIAAGDLTVNGIAVGEIKLTTQAANTAVSAGSVTAAAGTKVAAGAAGTTAGTLAAGALVLTTATGSVNVAEVTLGTNAKTNGDAIAAAINAAAASLGGGAAVNGTAAADAAGVITFTAGTAGANTLSLGKIADTSATAATNLATMTAQTGFSAAQLGTQANGGAAYNSQQTVSAINTALASAPGGTAVNGSVAGAATTGVITFTAGSNAAGLATGLGNTATSATAATANQVTMTARTGLTAAQLGTQAAGTDTVNHGTVSLSSSSANGIVYGGSKLASAGLAAAGGKVTATTTSSVSSLSSMDVLTSANAAKAISAIDGALATVGTSRASLGAYQNRFASVVSSLQTSSENLSASRSRIQDTDFAKETASLTRGQILQQAGTAMLAQANSLPNGVLALLRG
jgi:flagellin